MNMKKWYLFVLAIIASLTVMAQSDSYLLPNTTSFVTGSSDRYFSGEVGARATWYQNKALDGLNFSTVYSEYNLDEANDAPMWSWSSPAPASVLDPSNHFRIMQQDESTTPDIPSTLGRDPMTNYQLAYCPEGFSSSIRVGNVLSGAQAAMLTYNMNVTSAACVANMYYAIVSESPMHGRADDPFFALRILANSDNSDTLINIVNTTLCAQTPGEGCVADGFNGWHYFFDSEGYHSIYYCDWKKVSLDLGRYMGETVQIQIISSDCSFSSHFGYAYFAASFEGNGMALNSNHDTVTLVAPNGFESYRYFTASRSVPDANLHKLLQVSDTLAITIYNDQAYTWRPIQTFVAQPDSNKATFVEHSVGDTVVSYLCVAKNKFGEDTCYATFSADWRLPDDLVNITPVVDTIVRYLRDTIVQYVYDTVLQTIHDTVLSVVTDTVVDTIYVAHEATPIEPQFSVSIDQQPADGSPLLFEVGEEVYLSAHINGGSSLFNGTYQVSEIYFDPPFPIDLSTGIVIDTIVPNVFSNYNYAEDQFSPALPIFPFYFFGYRVDSLCVGENGMITFNPQAAGMDNAYSLLEPLPWSTPDAHSHGGLSTFLAENHHNAIYAFYNDNHINSHDTSSCIRFAVGHNDSVRFFCVVWDSVPIYPRLDSTFATFMIVGYEGSNIIDIYIKRVETFASISNSKALIGIQNATGQPQQPTEQCPMVVSGSPAAFWPEDFNFYTGNMPLVERAFRFQPQTSPLPPNTYTAMWQQTVGINGQANTVVAPVTTDGYGPTTSATFTHIVGADYSVTISTIPADDSTSVSATAILRPASVYPPINDTTRHTVDTLTITDTIIAYLVHVGDTIIINHSIHDTTFVYLHDTVISYINHYVHDTTFVHNYIHDTIYLTRTIYDTAAIENDMVQILTNYIDSLMHDENYIENAMLEQLRSYIDSNLPDTVTITDTFTVYQTLMVHDTVYIHDTVYLNDDNEAIDDIVGVNATIYQRDGAIVVSLADAAAEVRVYDAVGRIMKIRNVEASQQVAFAVPSSGVYLVRIGNSPARRVVVVR